MRVGRCAGGEAVHELAVTEWFAERLIKLRIMYKFLHDTVHHIIWYGPRSRDMARKCQMVHRLVACRSVADYSFAQTRGEAIRLFGKVS